MKIRFLLLLTAIGLFPLFAFQVRADTIALSFANHSGEAVAGGAPDGVTLGWSFSLSTSISVTQLGVWDGNNSTSFGPPGDGLRSDQLITIWTSGGTAEASATVPAGGGTLAGDFRYVSIAPQLLGPGNYVIGTHFTINNQDPNAAISSTITTASGVTFIEGRIGTGNAFPMGTFAGGGVWGPNFQFVPGQVSVPDAGASCVLLGIALAGVLGLRLVLTRRTFNE